MGHAHAFILGQAQRSYHKQASTDHPLILMQEIALAALADANVDVAQLDALACVDPFSWTYKDLAEQVATGIGSTENLKAFWRPAGGTTPQDLLHDITSAMARGEIDTALIVGAEAMRTRRKATRAGQTLPWPPRDKSIQPMRGQKPFSSEWEARHGLRLPIQSFPIHENAIRHAHGRTAQAQIGLAATLLHKNALIAAGNEHAWFRDAPSADLIATVTEDNRMISYPYTKRMNAIMDVDQAAAVILVSERVVGQLGDRSNAAAVLGGAGAEEVWNPIERRTLAESKAMQTAFDTALDHAGLAAPDIHVFDFYSCFPAPIQMAVHTLGMDIEDERPFSLTGGLAYAGGPGNNYVMHSIATAVAHLRKQPDNRVMVTGVGMANTKHAATLLSNGAHLPVKATGETDYRVATGDIPLKVTERAEGSATVASYTIEYGRDGRPNNVIYLLDLGDASRAIANASDPVTAADVILKQDPIGRSGVVSWDSAEERQFFSLDA